MFIEIYECYDVVCNSVLEFIGDSMVDGGVVVEIENILVVIVLCLDVRSKLVK